MTRNVLLSANNYHYPRGGAETVFLAHNRLLEGAGWQVVPFAMRHPENLPSEWEGYFAEEIEFGQDYGPLEKATMAAKVIYSFEARRKLAELIRVTGPAIFHAHNIYHHLSPSVLDAAGAAGVPVVLTVHDLKVACPSYKMLASDGVCERCRGGRLRNVVRYRCIKGSLALSSIIYAESKLHRLLGTYQRQVDRFVVPSRFYGRKLVEWGFDAAQMVYVPNCIDAADFEMRREVGDYFVYIGRLAPEKGLFTLVEAARLAGVRLKIVGDGPDFQQLREVAAASGADIEFTGVLRGTALRAAVAGARALVLASEWYENAPMSILEAYATGVPVIGADIGGIPEMVEAGQTGWIFESGSPAALASALQEAASTEGKQLLEMGAAGRRLVDGHFSRAAYLERVLALYRGLGAAA